MDYFLLLHPYMAIFRNVFGSVKQLFARLSIVLLMMTICRLIFFGFNHDNFPTASLVDFAAALWFDCVTIGLIFLPFVVIQSFKNIRYERFFNAVLKIYFHGVTAIICALNLMDVEYFRYTSKRSTFDLFTVLGAGSDFAQLAGTFLTDFWLIILFLVALISISEWLYRKTEKIKVIKNSWQTASIQAVVFSLVFVFIGRGGFQLKPVGIMEASQFTDPANSGLVLNTAFTMIKSYGKERLDFKDYFDKKTEQAIFNPIQHSKPVHLLPEKTNVVVIILESFGNEFVGAFNGGKSYTPFFDSIIGKSLTFEYGIANGKKSIEAVPAILASIPSLMDNPYISSPYGNNRIGSLASILKKNGYSTAFYHGATNGSMRFDSFAAQAGFEHYFGRYEYGNDAHFDKTWGILDEYFNPWTAKQLTKLKAPFFGTLFTLSSHHPFYIPPRWKNKVKKGNQPICASINYGDIALRKFFEEAKKQPWYKNTIFVLVADHSPATVDKLYSQRKFMYRVPIVFFDPQGRLKPKREQKIFQQLDIMPTLLDLLNIDTKYYAFGRSYFDPREREAFAYLEGAYFYFKKHQMLTFSKDKARYLHEFTVKIESSIDSLRFYKRDVRESERRLKAIIQRYNRDLVQNKTHVK